MDKQQQQQCLICPKDAIIAALKERTNDLERRCDNKEHSVELLRQQIQLEFKELRKKDIEPLVAWQNRVIGYSSGYAFIGALIGTYVSDKL